MALKPAFEDVDGGVDVVAEGDEQIEDIVAVEALGEIVARVNISESPLHPHALAPSSLL